MLLCAIGILALVGPMPASGAVANSHKHEKHLSKERVKDGSYVPRDAHHHNDLGEHNVEFDHEAIIGGLSLKQTWLIRLSLAQTVAAPILFMLNTL